MQSSSALTLSLGTSSFAEPINFWKDATTLAVRNASGDACFLVFPVMGICAICTQAIGAHSDLASRNSLQEMPLPAVPDLKW